MSHRKMLLGVFVAALVVTSSFRAWVRGNEDSVELVREVYVPHEELLRITAEDPSGVVMTFEEYRELVEKARANLPPDEDPTPPPPLHATAISSVVTGRVVGSSAHLRAEISIGVASDGWVRCDLGPAPEFLGRLSLDDQPAWGLLQAATHGTESRQKRRVDHRPTSSHLTLILRGKGTHTAVLEFTLAVREVEDGWMVEGHVPRTAGTLLRFDIGGRLTGTADPNFVHARYVSTDGKPVRTAFEVALGSSDHFRLRWKHERGEGRPAATITAGHQMIYRLEPRNPGFVWKAAIDIHRKKTDRLVLLPPPATRVLKVRGENVHSFRLLEPGAEGPSRTGVEVLLDRPAIGRILLLIEGVLDAPSPVAGSDGRRFDFTLEPPRADGALRDHGFLALEKDPMDRFAEIVPDGLEPVAQHETHLLGSGGGGFLTSDSRPHFAFSDAPARLRVTIAYHDARLRVRSMHRIGMNEYEGTVHSAFRVAAHDRRVYGLELRVPAGLRLVRLEEKEGNHGIRFELPVYGDADPGEHAVRIDLARALAIRSTLVLDARFEHAGFSGGDGSWRERQGELVYPWFDDAEIETTAVGLEVPTHFDAWIESLEGWRALEPYELEQRKLNSRLLVAAVERDRVRGEAPAPLALRLEKRPSRGVYQGVTHVEARGTELAVFVQIRLAVVGRPIESIALTLPVPSERPVSIKGPGVQEQIDGDDGQRFLVFQRPWIGERFFQCRFSVPLDGNALPVPLVDVSPAARDGVVAPASGNEAIGVFHGNRFVVFRSRGQVELRVNALEDLFAIVPDELPSFADMKSTARLVAAYRVQERVTTGEGERSTVVVDIHPRRDLLGRGVSRLDLTTTIDRGGVSRTEASCVLKYTKEQHLPVMIEESARILSVEVDGLPVRPVHDAESSGRRLIPLPPRNYATLRIVYERSSDPLQGTGVWTEHGLTFEDIPVGEVRWTLYHPPGLRVSLRESTVDSLSGRSIDSFARSFWARLLTLQWPRWTTIESLQLEPPRDVKHVQVQHYLPHLKVAEAERAEDNGQQLVAQQQIDVTTATTTDLPMLHLAPEGERVELRKLGGGAVVTLSYEDPFQGRFLRAAVFVLAILVGWVLRRDGGRRWLLAYLVGGLGVATFLPAALEWESRFFWIPLAEGLAALAILLSIGKITKLAWGWLSARVSSRREVASGMRAAGLVLLMLPIVGIVNADDASGDPTANDAVVIPYSLEGLVVPDTPDKRQVYVPYRKFVELWNLAHPEDRVAVDPADLPAKILIGNARYDFDSDGKTFQGTARLSVKVYTNEWTKLPLAFAGLQIESISVDGESRGVSYRNGVPFVALQGAGTHEIRISLAGKVARGLAEARLQASLVSGIATRVHAVLPRGIEVEKTGGGNNAPVVVETSDDEHVRTRCRVDLGADGRLALVWRAPGLESDRRVTLTSISDNGFFLALDGYHVVRREHVEVEGNRLRTLRYEITGDWDVLTVQGGDIAEWNLVAGESLGVDGTVLEIGFSRRANRFEFVVQGFASCGDVAVEPAGLRLVGGTRQEGFIGLRHHSLRRFPSEDVLSGLERASQQALLTRFPYDADKVPYDRLYHFHNDYRTQRIRSLPVASDGSIDSSFVGLVGLERVAVAARIVHRIQSGPGPIEYRVGVPQGWEIQTVKGSIVREWEVEERGAERELVIALRKRATSRDVIEWYADGPMVDGEALRLDRVILEFPTFRPGGTLRQNAEWALASPNDLQLGVESETNMLPLESLPEWLELEPGWQYRMGFRSRLENARLRLSLRQQMPLVESKALTTCRVESTHVDVHTGFDLDIQRASLPRVEVSLPLRARFVSVEIPGHAFRQEIQRSDDSAVLVAHFPTPARQSLRLEISYRLDRENVPNVVIEAPRVSGMQSSREFVTVLRHALHPLRVVDTNGLEERRPASDTWKSYLVVDSEWRLVVAEDEHRVHEDQDALVELAEIDTVYAADGHNWTIATYTMLNRSRQFLEFALPQGNQLWRVTVDGRPVVVSGRNGPEADNVILVPVERVQETDLSLQVSLVYTLPRADLPGRSAALQPAAPQLLGNIQTIETFWRVHVPDGYQVVGAEGNLTEVLGQVRHGKKVKGIMDQIRRIESAGKRASQRGKVRAAQNIMQLQQALSDALEDIDKESKDDRNLALQIGREDRAQQEIETQQYSTAGNEKLNELQLDQERRRELKATKFDPVDQAFEDGLEFVQKQIHAEPGRRRDAPSGGKGQTDLRSLRGHIVPPIVTESGVREPVYERIARVVSRPDLDDLQFVTASPLDIDVPRGGRVYTFRRTAGDPRIQLDVASTTLHGFVFHWFGLLITMGGLVVWMRRRGA